MNNITFNLKSMTDAELIKLRDAIDDLLRERVADNTPDVAIFYELVNKMLKQMLHNNLPQLSRLKLKSRPVYDKVVAVTHYLNEWAAEAVPTITEKKAIYYLYVSLVRDQISQTNISLNLNTVLNFKDKFPALIYDSFPGYVDSGLLPVIIKMVILKGFSCFDKDEEQVQ
jgi:hypothetical protein